MREPSVGIPSLSIIIPAHNEEARIEPTVVDYAEHFSDAQIIVVLNGCTDRTQDVIEPMLRRYPNVHMVVIKAKIGKGGAVRAGFLLARTPIVAFVDADSAFTAVQLRKLCTALGDNDAVIASRWLPQSVALTRLSFKRRAAGISFNLLIRLLFGLPFHDTQCGAKVFRSRALAPILDRLETANFAFDVDVLYLLKKAGAKIAEFPVTWTDVIGSKVAVIRSGTTMAAAVIRLRLRYSPLRYILPLYDWLLPTHPLRFYERLHILILNWRDIRNPAAGGAELYLHEMALRWVRQGHHVEWLTAGFRNGSGRETIDGIKVTRIGNSLSLYFLAPLFYLLNFRNRFDIIIDSENTVPFFTPLFSMKPKVCVMYQVSRNVVAQEVSRIVAWLLRMLEERLMPLVYRRVTFVACSQDTARDLVRHRISTRPVSVVHSGVEKSLTPGYKSSTPCLVYLGRLKRFKRVDLLLEAVPAMKRSIPTLTVHIAGVGDDEDRLKRLSSQLGIQDSVRFEGHVSSARKLELLQSAWLFVMPSCMEGWGISIIEANACGTPAVAFNVPGVREAIVHDKTGLLLSHEDQLAPAIIRLLLDHERRRELAQAALTHASRFSWEKAATAMLSLLTRTIASEPATIIRSEGELFNLNTRLESKEPLVMHKGALPPFST